MNIIRSLRETLKRAANRLQAEISWYREVFRPRYEEDRYSVDFDDDRFTVCLDGWPVRRMKWSGAHVCVLQMIDRFSYDMCVAIFLDRSGNRVSVFEMMTGFWQFLDAADLRFPGLKDVIEAYAAKNAGRFEAAEPQRYSLSLGSAPELQKE